MAKKTISQNVKVTPDLKLAFAPLNDEQKSMLQTLHANSIVLVSGPAGTGKSHVALAYALNKFFQNKYEHIILTRPLIQAGREPIGYLPGMLEDKTKDYFVPMFSLMSQMVDAESLKSLTKNNGVEAVIKTIPLAFMRGYTYNRTIVIMDEGQNCSVEQMRLFLTRIGKDSKMIICGDPEQSDIFPSRNGLEDASELLQGIPGIGFVKLSSNCIVRHPIIRDIEDRYQKRAAMWRNEYKLKTGT